MTAITRRWSTELTSSPRSSYIRDACWTTDFSAMISRIPTRRTGHGWTRTQVPFAPVLGRLQRIAYADSVDRPGPLRSRGRQADAARSGTCPAHGSDGVGGGARRIGRDPRRALRVRPGGRGRVRRNYASAPCPNPIYPGVPQLDLGAGVACGYLSVPENRAHPDGRRIR